MKQNFPISQLRIVEKSEKVSKITTHNLLPTVHHLQDSNNEGMLLRFVPHGRWYD